MVFTSDCAEGCKLLPQELQQLFSRVGTTEQSSYTRRWWILRRREGINDQRSEVDEQSFVNQNACLTGEALRVVEIGSSEGKEVATKEKLRELTEKKKRQGGGSPVWALVVERNRTGQQMEEKMNMMDQIKGTMEWMVEWMVSCTRMEHLMGMRMK